MAAKIYLVILWAVVSSNVVGGVNVLEEYITSVSRAEDEGNIFLLNTVPAYQTPLYHSPEDRNMYTCF
jgi:hypothetical protein